MTDSTRPVAVAEPRPPLLSASLPNSHSARSGFDLARAQELPERVLQFGEGNFLRGFVDWMLERMNRQGLFHGRAVLVQPIAHGQAEHINRQDGLYTVLLRGLVAGAVHETRDVITSVTRCLNPYADFEQVLEVATQPELRFVVSNTTEAGIRLDPEDRLEAHPSPSFPAKLTQLLYHRFRHFGGDLAKGWVMLPCELIERNGDALEKAVTTLARDWELPAAFVAWLEEACVFCNTLVDRIVTGYPTAEAERLEQEFGYRDDLLVAGEVFHCWVIEAPKSLEDELPLSKAGLNVVWTSDMTPYRERKVRILNGAHTLVTPVAYLAGIDTVGECMQDEQLRSFVAGALDEEILPTLSLPENEVAGFASTVLERFENPFIRHRLLDISLNSVSKYKARLLGTVLDNYERLERPAPRLAFGLAALLAFYGGGRLEGAELLCERDGTPYVVRDEQRVLEYFASEWASMQQANDPASCARLVQQTLDREDFWGCRVAERAPAFAEAVARSLSTICERGVRAALGEVVS